MDESDRKVFEESINDCFTMYEVLPKDLNVWWFACHRYELRDVCKALAEHMQDAEWGNLPPKPAQIVGRLARSGSDGYLPADEAWAIAIRAMDESETVVWTREMAEAWGCAKLIMAAGDEGGARMAFRAAYERRVTESGANGLRAKWFPSLGHDPEKRAMALQAAADRLHMSHFVEQAAIEDHSEQPVPAVVRKWIEKARAVIAQSAPRSAGRKPLDEIVAKLPEDCEERRKILAAMPPDQERRVRHVLGEVERKRQIALAPRE